MISDFGTYREDNQRNIDDLKKSISDFAFESRNDCSELSISIKKFLENGAQRKKNDMLTTVKKWIFLLFICT